MSPHLLVSFLLLAACAATRRGPPRPPAAAAADSVRRADALRRMGRASEAEALYREALQLEPKSVRAHVGLQVIGLERGRDLALRRAYRKCPDPFLAARLEPPGERQTALYERAVEPLRSLGLGFAAAAAGKNAYARRRFEEAVALDPGNPWARLALAQALLVAGRPGRAEAQALAALWSEPGHPAAAALLSAIADRRGDFRSAHTWALEAYRRAPAEGGLARRVHEVAMRAGPGRGMERAARLLADGEGAASLLAADLRRRLGDTEGARAALRKAGEGGATVAELDCAERRFGAIPLEPFVTAFVRGVEARYRHYSATGEAESFGEFVAWARGLFERETGRRLGQPGTVLEFDFIGKLVDPTLATDEPLVRACADAGLLLVLGQRAGGPPEALLGTIERREPARRIRLRGVEAESEVVWTRARHLSGYQEWAGGGDLAGVALERIVVVDLAAAADWQGSIVRGLSRLEPYRQEILAEPALEDRPATSIEDPAGVAQRLYLAEGEFCLADEVLVHESSHIVDAALHLPVLDHPLRNLGLALGRGFSATAIMAYLERNAQLAAIAEGPAPRAALATCCAMLETEGPHAQGYAEIVRGFVDSIAAEPERFPEIDGNRVILQQLHRLPEEKVRTLAAGLMERWGVAR